MDFWGFLNVNLYLLQDKKLLSSLMSCLDTELAGGAKNDIGVRIMYMFNLEKATLSEQKVEDHSWVCMI